MQIDIALVHFRAVDLRYLDAALYSVCQQRDLSAVQSLTVFNNDTTATDADLWNLVDLHTANWPARISVHVVHDRHGEEAKRCHSYSVNRVMGLRSPSGLGWLPSEWVLFTRSDYILHHDTVRDFVAAADPVRGFVTSHAYHHALDERADQRIEGFRDIEQHGWRTHPESTDILLTAVNGWLVDSSDKDAGVWLTRRRLWREVGGLNEQLTAWGYQQTVFQKALRDAGVAIVQLPKVYFHHMHHGGTFRSYDEAKRQLEAHWGTVEQLHDFRDVTSHKGSVCDELG
jgi:hypothetical protein